MTQTVGNGAPTIEAGHPRSGLRISTVRPLVVVVRHEKDPISRPCNQFGHNLISESDARSKILVLRLIQPAVAAGVINDLSRNFETHSRTDGIGRFEVKVFLSIGSFGRRSPNLIP